MEEVSQERERLAREVVDLAKSLVLADNHFLSTAVGRLKLEPSHLETEFATDGYFLLFDIERVLAHFKQAHAAPKFNLLHSVIHCLFLHPYVNASVDQALWNLACDIAAECTALELCGQRPGEAGLQRALAIGRIERDLGCRISAEKVYSRLRDGWWQDEVAGWMSLMKSDSHAGWYAPTQDDGDEDGEGSDEGTSPEGGVGRQVSEADSTESSAGRSPDEQGREEERPGDEGDAGDSQGSGSTPGGNDDAPVGLSSSASPQRGIAGNAKKTEGRRSLATSQIAGSPEDGSQEEQPSDSEAAEAQDAGSEGARGGSRGEGRSRGQGEGAGDSVESVAAHGRGGRLRTVALPSRERQMAEWRQVATALAVNLQTMSARSAQGLSALVDELEEAARPRMDYRDFLRQFAIPGEVMRLSEDEFDNVFYSYGMQLYGDLPLIEPLEYREERRVREFVVAIDTSASVQGDAVRAFLTTTFDILKSTESFHERVHLRILQCDAQVRTDDRITSLAQLHEWNRTMTVVGGGGTDFRPVFAYVDELVARGEFRNLGGLVYFTDGWGTYPEWIPSYKVAFAFYDEDRRCREVPPWAMQIILDSDTM